MSFYLAQTCVSFDVLKPVVGSKRPPASTMRLLCARLFGFIVDCPLSVQSCVFFANCTPYCRSERDIATSTHHIAAQGNQLCSSSSWHYQVTSCAESWASSDPLTCCVPPCASEAGGVSRPRSVALVHNTRTQYIRRTMQYA